MAVSTHKRKNKTKKKKKRTVIMSNVSVNLNNIGALYKPYIADYKSYIVQISKEYEDAVLANSDNFIGGYCDALDHAYDKIAEGMSIINERACNSTLNLNLLYEDSMILLERYVNLLTSSRDTLIEEYIENLDLNSDTLYQNFSTAFKEVFSELLSKREHSHAVPAIIDIVRFINSSQDRICETNTDSILAMLDCCLNDEVYKRTLECMDRIIANFLLQTDGYSTPKTVELIKCFRNTIVQTDKALVIRHREMQSLMIRVSDSIIKNVKENGLVDIFVYDKSLDDFVLEYDKNVNIEETLQERKHEKEKIYNYLELNKMAIDAGYTLDRCCGDHGVFVHPSYDKHVIIPQGRRIGKGLQKKILKEIRNQ